MPTYDYECRSCGSITEVIHSMLEDGPSVCERCGGELRRVLHATGIIFKGKGFYKTDSRASSSGTVSGTSGSASTGSSDGSASDAARPKSSEKPSDTGGSATTEKPKSAAAD